MSTNEARTYARALYETLIGTAVAQLRQAAETLGDGPVTADRIASAVPAGASAEIRNFLAVLANEGSTAQLSSIVDALESIIARPASQALDADVTSAVALSASQQDSITADLRQRYGDQLVVNFLVEESIIGGLIIRVGDQVLDNSLRTRLSAVQRNMLAS
jgi:F-type H+-transporting ATPase subunit delta